MRKFNLRGAVVQRMKGIPKEDHSLNEADHSPDDTFPTCETFFLPEQGQLCCAWRTDVGRIRKNNQDAVIIGNGLAGVADGMGGHNGGEIASAGLRDGLLRETRGCVPDRDKLIESICKVNKELWDRQEADASLTGMGTTLTIIWPSPSEMIIAQVGDSRAYLLRDGVINQITNDHSMVADMVRKGVLTEEQAACHPMRNYITRAVGTDDSVESDIIIHDRQKGDCWLICSDGLHGMLSKSDLFNLINPDELDESADKLLQAALENGGRDNITLVLLRDDSGIVSPLPDDQINAEDPSDKSGHGEVTDQ